MASTEVKSGPTYVKKESKSVKTDGGGSRDLTAEFSYACHKKIVDVPDLKIQGASGGGVLPLHRIPLKM